MEQFDIMKALDNCELFKGLDEKSIESIAGLFAVEKYEPGEYVFYQGDFGKNIFVIAEGSIILERITDLGGSRKGKVIIGMLGKGRAFGCWSTLLGEPHNLMSSATCQKPTTLLSANGNELRTIMLSNANLGMSVMEKICFLLRDRIQGAYGAMEKI